MRNESNSPIVIHAKWLEEDKEKSTASCGVPLREAVDVALAAIPEGELLKNYFGLNGKSAAQTADEADESLQLIEQLRLSLDEEEDCEDLFQAIAEHADASDVSADALRALRGAAAR